MNSSKYVQTKVIVRVLHKQPRYAMALKAHSALPKSFASETFKIMFSHEIKKSDNSANARVKWLVILCFFLMIFYKNGVHQVSVVTEKRFEPNSLSTSN